MKTVTNLNLKNPSMRMLAFFVFLAIVKKGILILEKANVTKFNITLALKLVKKYG